MGLVSFKRSLGAGVFSYDEFLDLLLVLIFFIFLLFLPFSPLSFGGSLEIVDR